MRIVAVHLLNDFSGSPKVLRQLLDAWVKAGLDVHLFTAGGKNGFLSGLQGVEYHPFWYRWKANPFARLVTYSISQMLLFYKAYRMLQKEDLLYVNTVLPYSAALAGKLRGCRIVYHLHETTVNPPILKRFLFGVVKWAATEAICVSRYMAQNLDLGDKRLHILNNVLDNAFLKNVILKENRVTRDKILMICSMKWYKGVFEFIELANVLTFYQFRLVLNASEKEIASFFKGRILPENLEILPVQTNVHPHFQWADLVLNLSRPDGWVETFGLTILEAMAYHLPVIVPPIGGITELVENGKNGYKIDCRNPVSLSRTAIEILQDNTLYESLQDHAALKVKNFSEENFVRHSLEILMPKPRE